MKKVIASLTVCCLLFGSLTLGSLTLSSCSSKNNPANRRGIDSVAKKGKAGGKADNETLLDTLKDST